MACFMVPVAQAVVTTVITKAVESKEKKAGVLQANAESHCAKQAVGTKLPFSRKLKWLNNLLWGGSLLLAFEHVWHGEVLPWAPFLTANAAEILREMATVGVAMAGVVTAVWAGMVFLSNAMEKRCQDDVAVSAKESL